MKVCLPCPGLDHIQRGFETYTRDLFGALGNRCEAHLVKSNGPGGKGVHVVGSIRRTHRVYDFLPAGLKTGYRRFDVECNSFALAMIPLLLRERFDLIHFSEIPLGVALRRLRKLLGLDFRLLLSNGAPWEPADCVGYDGIHQVSPAHHAACSAYGIPEEFQHFVPYGFNPAVFSRPADFNRREARRALGIPAEAKVVLSLAALNRSHKRIDWLITEFAEFARDRNVFLLMVGNPEEETPALRSLAEEKLGSGTWTMTRVPFDEVPRMLWLSDAMVQTSLDEGFGRTLVEAMLADVPVLCHPHETARSLIAADASFVDMAAPGALAERLVQLAEEPALPAAIREENRRHARRFGWDRLVDDYLSMYQAVLGHRNGEKSGKELKSGRQIGGMV
jgi:glycosyltransferase involved in cell wall biosynthesis